MLSPHRVLDLTDQDGILCGQVQKLPEILSALSDARRFAFDIERACFALALQRLCAPGSDSDTARCAGV